jgi:hypothetical protein
MVKTVVVLGASFAGLAVSHRLLKYTRQQEKDLRVILVSKVKGFQILRKDFEGWDSCTGAFTKLREPPSEFRGEALVAPAPRNSAPAATTREKANNFNRTAISTGT